MSSRTVAKKQTNPKRTKKNSREPTTDAVEILHRRYFEGRPEMLASLAEAEADDEVGRMVYALRTEAGLTPGGLAKRVGTTAAVISRLEEADYEGHALALLRRIAAALGKRVELQVAPVEHTGANPV